MNVYNAKRTSSGLPPKERDNQKSIQSIHKHSTRLNWIQHVIYKFIAVPSSIQFRSRIPRQRPTINCTNCLCSPLPTRWTRVVSNIAAMSVQILRARRARMGELRLKDIRLAVFFSMFFACRRWIPPIIIGATSHWEKEIISKWLWGKILYYSCGRTPNRDIGSPCSGFPECRQHKWVSQLLDLLKALSFVPVSRARMVCIHRLANTGEHLLGTN